jgi:hypothetical protein
MNNGEANDLNKVLDFFLTNPRHGGPVSFEKAKAAAVRLADRAYRQLYAGSSGADVAKRFDQLAAMNLRVDAAFDKAIDTAADAGDELAARLRREPATPLADGPGVSIQ